MEYSSCKEFTSQDAHDLSECLKKAFCSAMAEHNVAGMSRALTAYKQFCYPAPELQRFLHMHMVSPMGSTSEKYYFDKMAEYIREYW